MFGCIRRLGCQRRRGFSSNCCYGYNIILGPTTESILQQMCHFQLLLSMRHSGISCLMTRRPYRSCKCNTLFTVFHFVGPTSSDVPSVNSPIATAIRATLISLLQWHTTASMVTGFCVTDQYYCFCAVSNWCCWNVLVSMFHFFCLWTIIFMEVKLCNLSHCNISLWLANAVWSQLNSLWHVMTQ